MFYRLLGNLEIVQEEQPLELPSGHTSAVLATLLISANRPISKEDLLRVAWNGDVVKEAQLHKAANALRQILGQIGRRQDLVTHPRFGYEMRVSTTDLDILLFRQRLREAGEAKDSLRSADEISALRRALSLWRGPGMLANLPATVLAPEREKLEQRRRHAAGRLFDLELASGEYERTLDDLAEMAGYYPADGRLCEQLMVVQAHAGQPADAVSAYERHAAALLEETGGNPDPALRELAYAIGGGDPGPLGQAMARIARRAQVPGGAAADTGRGRVIPRQLPPDTTQLVGREDVVAEATWLLSSERNRDLRVIVFSGQGGVGKTAVAVRVAHEVSEHYPDGQLYLELRGPMGPPAELSEILSQFLRAFGHPVPERLDERISAYRDLLAARRVLIVLDDVTDTDQIQALIPAGPGSAILATARQHLPNLSNAHFVPPLTPLEPAAAALLFRQVVNSHGIDLAGEQEDVDRVVALCGGLPLALRVAATLRAHDHLQPTAGLADLLARQGPAVLPAGDTSVARTIGAGFEQLNEPAQRLFLGLGLLPQPLYGLAAAAAVLAGSGSGVDPAAALADLAASEMLEAAGPRYRFHDLTREYARRLARDVPAADQASMLSRVYRALLTLTRRAHAGLYGGDFELIHSEVPDEHVPPEVLAEIDESPLGWFERERLTILAAVSHCADLRLTSICWDLAVSAHEFYTVAGYYDDWYQTHTTALAACRRAGQRRGEAILLACLGQPALVASRHGGVSGLTALERSVRLLTQEHDRHGLAIARRTLAHAQRGRGHIALSLRLFRQALADYEAAGDTLGRWQTLRYIGQTQLDLGQSRLAMGELRQAYGLAEELGRPRPIAQTRYWIGQACLADQQLTDARRAFEAMLGGSRPVRLNGAYALHGLGEVTAGEGNLTRAREQLAQAAVLAREEGDANLEGRVALSVAGLNQEPGEIEARIHALEGAVLCFLDCDAAYLQFKALYQLAMAQREHGDGATAEQTWDDLENLYTGLDIPEADRLWRRPPG